MYQSAIICVPSGLIDGRTMLMTLSRLRIASSSVRVEAVVDELGRGLRRRDLGRVQREALDGDRLAVGDELLDLGLGQPARIGEPRVDLAELLEPGEVGRRRDEEGDEGPALARLAELDQLDAVRALREQLVVPRAACPSWRASDRRPSGSRRISPAIGSAAGACARSERLCGSGRRLQAAQQHGTDTVKRI